MLACPQAALSLHAMGRDRSMSCWALWGSKALGQNFGMSALWGFSCPDVAVSLLHLADEN